MKKIIFEQFIQNENMTASSTWKFKIFFHTVEEAIIAKNLIRDYAEVCGSDAPKFRVRTRGKWTYEKVVSEVYPKQRLSCKKMKALVKTYTKSRKELPMYLADYVVLYIY